MKSREWVATVAVLAAVPGVLRDTSVVFWKQGSLVTTHLDERFAGILEKLPPAERVGFITDDNDPASARYFDALYALSPHLVFRGPDARYVVADVADPRQVEAIASRWGLRVVVRPSPGVALLEQQ